MMLGSGALAQDVANGKVLYTQKFCAACHLADPTLNRDGILEGANDP
jgi:cytochrome c551/c552